MSIHIITINMQDIAPATAKETIIPQVVEALKKGWSSGIFFHKQKKISWTYKLKSS